MITRAALAIAFTMALAGCGQATAPTPPEAPPETVSLAPPAAPLVTPEIQAKLAALPAPYNQADYLEGRRQFAQCKSCHVVEAGAGNRVGPNLHGVFGRKAGTAPDFNYSPVLKNAGFVWDMDQLNKWLANPQKDLPGTRMTFAGIADPNKRRDVIAYLEIESSK
jgi:cytochrome c